jgi:hypothetical protein
VSKRQREAALPHIQLLAVLHADDQSSASPALLQALPALEKSVRARISKTVYSEYETR